MLVYCVVNKFTGLVAITENRNRADRYAFALNKQSETMDNFVEARGLLDEDFIRQVEFDNKIK